MRNGVKYTLVYKYMFFFAKGNTNRHYKTKQILKCDLLIIWHYENIFKIEM